MKKYIIGLVFLFMLMLAGCSTQEKKDVTDDNVEADEEKEIDMASETLLAIVEKCKLIYSQADKGEASNIVLDENTVHEMIDAIAEDGISVTCGSYDYNMRNYETVHKSLLKAQKGKSVETEFYEINAGGIFRYNHLQFRKGKLTVTSIGAVFDDTMKPRVQQVEKLQVYAWEYTEKGWMIWEKTLSENQEMDMHVFYRILPLDNECREIMGKCIVPISYFCNNLFLEDWDKKSLQKIEFNDLFDFLYMMETGTKLDEAKYAEGVPKEEFENVIQQYFDVSTEELERYARYDAVTGKYPWIAIGPRNRVQQFQPFPEVVKCVKNANGTLAVYVEAIFAEEGKDCSFGHVVTIREEEDGRWVYLGNQVDRENAYLIPGYRARREYIGE